MASNFSGDDVTEVRGGHQLDVAALTSHLAAQGLSWFEGPLKVQQFGHGQSNPSYLCRCANGAGRAFVLRKQPPGDIISKTAHRVDREYQMMAALGPTDVVRASLTL